MKVKELKALCEKLEAKGKGDYETYMVGNETGITYAIGEFCHCNSVYEIDDEHKEVFLGECGD